MYSFLFRTIGLFKCFVVGGSQFVFIIGLDMLLVQFEGRLLES